MHLHTPVSIHPLSNTWCFVYGLNVFVVSGQYKTNLSSILYDIPLISKVRWMGAGRLSGLFFFLFVHTETIERLIRP